MFDTFHALLLANIYAVGAICTDSKGAGIVCCVLSAIWIIAAIFI